jgi:hypothetical protein
MLAQNKWNCVLEELEKILFTSQGSPSSLVLRFDAAVEKRKAILAAKGHQMDVLHYCSKLVG